MAIFYIFLILMFISFILAIASLITPKAAFFLKNKTRVKGFVCYLAICAISFLGYAFITPKEVHQQLHAENAQRQEQAEKEKAAKLVAEKAEKERMEQEKQAAAKGEKERLEQERLAAEKAEKEKQEKLASLDNSVLPYFQFKVDEISTPRRKRGQVWIYPATESKFINQSTLTATCMAAAKYYAKAYGFKALKVFIGDMPGNLYSESERLAQCSYSPDNGGWSGDQNWTWTDVEAAKRDTTAQEKQIRKLWLELRGQYQKNGMTDEEPLKAAIAKKLKIKPEKVTLLAVVPEAIEPENFAEVSPFMAAFPEGKEKIKQAQFELNDLYQQLIELCKDREFQQRGLSAKDAAFWKEQVEVLRNRWDKQSDVPPMVKAGAGYLLQLALAIVHRNQKDVEFNEKEVLNAINYKQ